ncbi:heme/hemin ABC transporter substrate-binding protein [Pseudodonghicola xiamenensis]|uniref:Hemin ABC transporter substrate-binding protein n=1 Tax=Pseudodonghicola xiamenensis TaxID=337702 RepID=A0A8J3MEI9_9RHOB|nr:ABC transporter substrate-binding protein [Pseudodonghicola xiamenensis]GHH04346.1 hemin ABC transporter substrate-binding protein [Pseudodonghicola xiamenensis]
MIPRRTALGALLALALPLPLLAAEPAQRVIGVGGAVTETIYALGAGDRLVARDTTSTYPGTATELPDVGYMRRLSPEGVLSVAPDLIIAEEGAGPAETVQILEEAAIPFVTIPAARDGAGVAARIRAVGAALGLEDKANALASEVESKIVSVADASASTAETPVRVLFVLSAAGGRLMASGVGTEADAMIRLAGGINAIEGFPGYKQLTDEAVLAAQPDVILMMDRGPGGNHGSANVLEHPAIAITPAGQAKRLVAMDGLYLLGFGPRTADAVADLHAALYPEKG